SVPSPPPAVLPTALKARAVTPDAAADARPASEPLDSELIYKVRQALRDQLRAPGLFAQLPLPQWSESDARAVPDVAVAVPSTEEQTSAWRNAPLEGMSETKNPWFMQKRASADGDEASPFLCSLPPGGERLTGILRSATFTVPTRLHFFMAGHDGPPLKPAQQ